MGQRDASQTNSDKIHFVLVGAYLVERCLVIESGGLLIYYHTLVFQRITIYIFTLTSSGITRTMRYATQDTHRLRLHLGLNCTLINLKSGMWDGRPAAILKWNPSVLSDCFVAKRALRRGGSGGYFCIVLPRLFLGTASPMESFTNFGWTLWSSDVLASLERLAVGLRLSEASCGDGRTCSTSCVDEPPGTGLKTL